jgi:transcription antitermination factor NusG
MGSLSWFAIRTKPRHEKAVAMALSGKGYEHLLPLYTSRRLWSDHRRTTLPLFSGYVFCRFDIEDRLPVLVTPGVFAIIGAGRTPIPLDDSEIVALQAVINGGVAAQPWPFIQVGQRVRITRGALEGVEGLLLGCKSGDRLVLSVSLLQRSVAVQVDREYVQAVSIFSKSAQQLELARRAVW